MKSLTKTRFCIFLTFAVLTNLLVNCSKRADGTITGSGTLEAREVLISAKSSGQITELAVREGDDVNLGQVIARVDVEKLLIQRKQAAAGLNELRLTISNSRRAATLAKDNLVNVEKKYQRFSALLAEGSLTQQQFDDMDTARKAAQTQHETAETMLLSLKAKEEQVLAQIELLDNQIADGEITAPIAGTVLETYLEAGEIARPGSPVASLADLKNVWIKIFLKENELGKIRLGSAATLRISSQDNTFPGKVTWISDKAEFTPKNVQTKEARADLVYAVKVEAQNVDGILKIGMPADVEIEPLN
jgi:HlyD family secretion protein